MHTPDAHSEGRGKGCEAMGLTPEEKAAEAERKKAEKEQKRAEKARKKAAKKEEKERKRLAKREEKQRRRSKGSTGDSVSSSSEDEDAGQARPYENFSPRFGQQAAPPKEMKQAQGAENDTKDDGNDAGNDDDGPLPESTAISAYENFTPAGQRPAPPK